jgi:hypothetical protein
LSYGAYQQSLLQRLIKRQKFINNKIETDASGEYSSLAFFMTEV